MTLLNQTKRTLLLTAVLTTVVGFIMFNGCDGNGGNTPVTPPPSDTTGTPPVTPPVTPPTDSIGSGNDTTFGAPSNVTATATSQNSITVNWSPVFGATMYYVYNSKNTPNT